MHHLQTPPVPTCTRRVTPNPVPNREQRGTMGKGDVIEQQWGRGSNLELVYPQRIIKPRKRGQSRAGDVPPSSSLGSGRGRQSQGDEEPRGINIFTWAQNERLCCSPGIIPQSFRLEIIPESFRNYPRIIQVGKTPEIIPPVSNPHLVTQPRAPSATSGPSLAASGDVQK